MKDQTDQVRKYFREITASHRQTWKKRYEDQIAKDSTSYMVTHWKHGLDILNEVIQELDQVTT
jgi:hypothetical protein